MRLSVFVGRCLLVLAACLSVSLMFPHIAERTWFGWFYGPIVGLSGFMAAVMTLTYWRCAPRPPAKQTGTIRMFGGWMVLLLLASSASAQSVTRSPELQAALVNAALSMQSCGGQFHLSIDGNSNTEGYQNILYDRLWNTTYKAVRRTDLRFIRNGISGHGIPQYTDPNNNGWEIHRSKVAAVGGAPCATQIALLLMTRVSPGVPANVTTAADIDAVIKNLLRDENAPDTKTILLVTMNKTFCDAPCLAPSWSTQSEDALYASYMGVHTYTLASGRVVTIPVDYAPLWRLGWQPYGAPGFNLLNTDNVHEMTIGANNGATFGGDFLIHFLHDDPLHAYYQLFTDVPAPAAESGGSADPVYGSLSGALRKWYNGACSLVWNENETALPTALCEGL